MTTFITPILRKAALTAAGLTITAGAAAGPLATIAHAAPAAPAAAVQADKPDPGTGTGKDNGKDNGKGAEKKAKELAVNYQAQPNFYYCGPAATRNALSADGHDISMDDLAKQMGTTEAGTNSANDITAALNKITGDGRYHTTEIRDAKATDAQKQQLRADIIDALDNNRAVVANIAGTATDTDGGVHSFEGGHYIAVHAYRDSGQQVKIADSANPTTASYWITTDALADWTATRGYSH
jgi:Peptidase_C39 like family